MRVVSHTNWFNRKCIVHLPVPTSRGSSFDSARTICVSYRRFSDRHAADCSYENLYDRSRHCGTMSPTALQPEAALLQMPIATARHGGNPTPATGSHSIIYCVSLQKGCQMSQRAGSSATYGTFSLLRYRACIRIPQYKAQKNKSSNSSDSRPLTPRAFNCHRSFHKGDNPQRCGMPVAW